MKKGARRPNKIEKTTDTKKIGISSFIQLDITVKFSQSAPAQAFLWWV